MLRIRPRDSDFDLVNFISIDFEMKGCMYAGGAGEKKRGERERAYFVEDTGIIHTYIHAYMHS